MNPDIHAVFARQHGLITYAQAASLGCSSAEVARLLRAGKWVRVRRGVYSEADTWNSLDEFRGRPLLRVRAAHLVVPSTHWFSHDSAALLHGLGCPDPKQALVHLTQPGVTGGRVRGGLKRHGAAVQPGQTCEVEGLPVLVLARTAVDMAREHGPAHGLAAVDAARRRGVTVAELQAVFEKMWCWPGSEAVRYAIGYSDSGAESYLESLGRDLVLELGIGRPKTQFGLTHGGRVAWCDLRVGRHIFEVDGRAKYRPQSSGGGLADDPDAALWEEKRRQDFISGFKLGVSRITWFDCHGGRVLAKERLRREYWDTVARFGSDVSDLARYRPPEGSRRRRM